MINTNNFSGLGLNKSDYSPNSNFKVPHRGIYKDSIDRWKETLNKEMIKIIEFVVGPELKYLGYKISNDDYQKFDWDNYQIISNENNKTSGWKTHNNDAPLDFFF